MTDIGPVQLLAIGFGPEAEYRGQIMDELERLEGQSLIRVLDLLFVGQDADTGELVALDYQGDDLGALVGLLLGFPFADATVAEPVVVRAPAGTGTGSVGLSRPQLEELVRTAPPDSAIGIVLLEHVWAKGLKTAIRQAGGVPMFEGFLSGELIEVIGEELEETVRILEELERETEPATPVG
jgi:hypothetical protein